MPAEYFPYFSFKANLEFEKKAYDLKITLFFNSKLKRKEFEISSDQFSGQSKLLIFQSMVSQNETEWLDINNQDNSAFIQELGEVINRHNI